MASIEKRVRNGRVSWSVRYRDPAGRSRRRDFPRRADAERWLVENEAAKHKGGWVDPVAGRLLFREQAERWYATTAALRPSTRRDYRLLLDWQVLPFFGELPLNAIDTLMVREWLAALAAGTVPGPDKQPRAPIGPKRARKAYNVLRMVLASAVEAGRLARNPADGVRLPKVQAREIRCFTAAEIEQLAGAITPPYSVLIRFAAYTGLRPEELTALKVRHLDLLHGACHVVEAAPEVAGRLEWGPLKDYERRTIKLPKFLVEELASYLHARGGPGPDELVFTGPEGGPLRWSKWGPRHYKRALARAGLDLDARPYDLRHTAASLAIHEGASVLAVQRLLGHSSATVTLNTYAHLWPSELDALADRLDAARARAVAGAPEGRREGQRRAPGARRLRRAPGTADGAPLRAPAEGAG